MPDIITSLRIPPDATAVVQAAFSVGNTHGARLARAATSQAEAMTQDDPRQYLHALSRYGVWAEQLAADMEAGSVSLQDATTLLRGLAALQSGAFASWIEDPVPPPTIHVNPSEGEMDLLIAEEIVADAGFFIWLLERAGQPPGSLISVGRSQSTIYGETDLLVIYETLGGIRHALLIEDKIAAVFMPDQDGRYRKRLAEGVREGLWAGGATVLIAPQKYLDGASKKDFDVQISYEAVLEQVRASGSGLRTAFKVAMLQAATDKAAKPWVKVVDQRLSAFHEELIAHAVARNPELPIPQGDQERAPTSKWVVFGLPAWPRNRVFMEIRPHNGVVDLRLVGVTHPAVVEALASKLWPGMSFAVASASIAVRLTSHRVDVDHPLAPQIGRWEKQLDNCGALLKFLEEQAAEVRELIGTP